MLSTIIITATATAALTTTTLFVVSACLLNGEISRWEEQHHTT